MGKERIYPFLCQMAEVELHRWAPSLLLESSAMPLSAALMMPYKEHERNDWVTYFLETEQKYVLSENHSSVRK